MGIYWPSRCTPTNNPKALAFDMDGVLIESEALHKSTKRQALRSAGIEVDETVFSRYIGRSDQVMITDVAKIHGCSEDEIEAILAEKDRLYALGQRDLRSVPELSNFCVLGLSPEVFEKAIAQMEMAPSDCWIIEDALNGVVATRDVPCFTVKLTTSFGEFDLLRAGADVVVDQFGEIQTLLREVCTSEPKEEGEKAEMPAARETFDNAG